MQDAATATYKLAESLSAAPPDNARRRAGHSRMPDWLSRQRQRPGRDPRR